MPPDCHDGTSCTRGVIFEESMGSDPDWTTEGLWAWGVPQGNDGSHGGGLNGPDPTSGCTGANVYGYNLAGGYEDSLLATYLTTPPIDCSGYTDVRLSFCRWLNVEESQYDHALLEVSHDGSTWVTVFDHSGPTLIESAWSTQAYDISAVADGQLTVYVRWVMGPSDSAWNYGGWNIDDVVINGMAFNPIAPSILSSVPADGYIDPRNPSGGIDQISITFDMCVAGANGAAVSPSAFAITSTSSGIAPIVQSVDVSGNPAVIVALFGPLEVEQWSTLTANIANFSGVGAVAEIDIGALPCYSNQSGNVNVSDATAFVNKCFLGGQQRVELCDINRSGNINISDATEWAMLFLNGWSGRSLPPQP